MKIPLLLATLDLTFKGIIAGGALVFIYLAIKYRDWII